MNSAEGSPTGQRSPDGRYWWDGQAWRALSSDGRHYWDGQAWHEVDAPAVPVYASPPPSPAPGLPYSQSAQPAQGGVPDGAWRDRLARHVGAAGPQAEAGAAAATAAAAGGASDEAALQEGRRAAGLYPRPGTEFFRDPKRVALLLLLTGGIYEIWWLWTTFALGVRERFAGSRNFAWILAPIYNLLLIRRNARNLRDAEIQYAGSSGLNPGLIVGLVVIPGLINLALRRADGLVYLAGYFVGDAVLAVAGYLNQTSVNRYLAARYPEARARTSAGEIVAAALGGIFVVLMIIGALTPK